MKYFFMGVLLSTLVSANPYTYSCEIKGAYKFDSQGKLVPENQKLYIGQHFNVERKSGVVLGGGLDNSSYPTKTVLDKGGKEQSYKLIWISEEIIGTNGGRNIVFLSIEEFNEKHMKPFSIIDGSNILSGVCQ